MKVFFLFLSLSPLLLTLDIYFVRHAARSPLVLPMKHIFGVDNKHLTLPGKTQSYYYGKQLYARHFKTLPKLKVYSTNFERTLTSAQYFLKGWYGIYKKGNYLFHAETKYLPPSNISIHLGEERHHVDQFQYSNLIFDLPFIEDTTNRKYRKYRIQNGRKERMLINKIKDNADLCKKFQTAIPGSCSRMSINEFFNFVDILNCLDVINKTVPNVTLSDMSYPLQLINDTYQTKFIQKSFPTRAVQQDFLLIQNIYRKNQNNVNVIFTHDTQLFYLLRTLIGIEKLNRMFQGNMIMSFLSSLHFQFSRGVVRMFFNDLEFHVERCGSPCTIKRLFNIMNN